MSRKEILYVGQVKEATNIPIPKKDPIVEEYAMHFSHEAATNNLLSTHKTFRDQLACRDPSNTPISNH